jgi:hypothetical protein
VDAIGRKQGLLFVNKKKQKNFNNFWPVALEQPWRRGAKVFWFFFSKKNSLFLLTFLIFWTAWELRKKAKRLLHCARVPPVVPYRGSRRFFAAFCSQKDVLSDCITIRGSHARQDRRPPPFFAGFLCARFGGGW